VLGPSAHWQWPRNRTACEPALLYDPPRLSFRAASTFRPRFGGPLLVRDVLAKPELRLTLLAGGENLDRPVSRVYTTDLLDPSRYLTGEELVLTGLMWRRVPEDSEAFVSALAAAGVSALGAGDAALGTVPCDLVEACERHGVPLLEVPVEISFRAITDGVDPDLWAERATDLAAVLGRQRGLVDAVAGGVELDALLTNALSGVPGAACWVLSTTGRVIGSTAPLPPKLATELVTGYLSAPMLPVAVREAGRQYVVAAARSRPGNRVADWVVATYHPDVHNGLVSGAVEELRSIVALVRARHDDGLRIERRLAGELVTALVQEAEPAELRARLRSCALPGEGRYLVVSAALTGQPSEAALDVIEEVARCTAEPSAVGLDATTGRFVGVLAAPFPAANLMARCRAAVALVAIGLAGTPAGSVRLCVGLSEVIDGIAALPGALAEAEHARQFAATEAQAGAEPAAVACAEELASHLALLAGVPAPVRRAFRVRLLGGLEEYDRRHEADLVHTLETFLDCSGSWIKCAAMLHVHVNTLRYRIRRIEELTGRDLGRFSDRVDLFLALRTPPSADKA
jgi:hypothetical protein